MELEVSTKNDLIFIYSLSNLMRFIRRFVRRRQTVGLNCRHPKPSHLTVNSKCPLKCFNSLRFAVECVHLGNARNTNKCNSVVREIMDSSERLCPQFTTPFKFKEETIEEPSLARRILHCFLRVFIEEIR